MLLLAFAAARTTETLAQSNNQCDLPGESPDVIVGDVSGDSSYGSLGGISAFSVGTVSCNVGSCWLNWISNTPDHPVIGQNMFRLKDGRFEQIGQSWLKHGFTALQGSVCSTSCMPSGTGSRLGVRCSDPYSSGLNGSQTNLGPKFEVNPFTGVFPYPPTNGGLSGNAIYKRLQVHDADLDPILNPGALYFIEGQYVTRDDAAAGNHMNNASYRPVTVSVAGSTFNLTLTGTTQRQRAGIEAWKATDPAVTETQATAPGDGRFYVSAKATPLGGGVYHYEYAIQNLNSDRAAGSFTVPFPPGATITNVGFHDVDYHSGEPFDGTDWTPTVGSDSVGWATASYDQNPNANALRWGTLYNFRFDANVPPGTTSAGIGLFKSGFIGSMLVSTIGPSLCNSNGVCDPGENCANCAADCFHQGGGQGCCGNTSCDAGENPCRCATDCGTSTAAEAVCGDTIDNDCDGVTDCVDLDCCASPACAASDADGDHFAAACDCNDANGAVYPGAPQLCDGVNNDCNAPGWPAVPAGEQDADGDGARVCGGDCDDANPQRFPGNPESCDGIDNDCAGGVPANEVDADGDTVRMCGGDCDDANVQVWATPGEARSVVLAHDRVSGETRIDWSPPLAPGGIATGYDTLRSGDADDFTAGGTCVESNGTDTTTLDSSGSGGPGVSYYLVRARNACPSGLGSLGTDSNGTPRTGRTCP